MLHRYFVLAIALVAVLVGVQVPNFITQYQQRLDSQLTEAMVYYKEYQLIADKYLNGDMNALIQMHEESDNPVFKDEAIPLRELIRRVDLYRHEQQQLQQGYLKQLWFVATEANREMVDNTWRAYSFNVPLTRQAVFSGVIAALLAVLLFDGCIGGCKLAYRRFRRKRHQPHRHAKS
ncbi:DUF2937 family protein [Pseudidiomarina andamanensis]|uniref:DUF2937 family protein n=1 Tax=Pseudidiomarina andamanensis TaxID=1940690 RepID=A0AA92ER14_9GAMM|nr:DUF2937 family protein [Pseudidiomarina andamanensis]MDS0218393.1 DUF2937 family protein [Pseudidiomarina andamanensis]QGT95277.1 DUF2937 family protein [Pseudidiomarina andamanensis]